MDNYGTNPVFRYYREAIGKENIKLAIVEATDKLDFVSSTDTVLLRTANMCLIQTIQEKGIISTAEDFALYELTKDKIKIGNLLSRKGIKTPHQFTTHNLVDGIKYFVKPRFGSDSIGITEKSICNSKEEVLSQSKLLSQMYGEESMIEEFIDGEDCTVACVVEPNKRVIYTYAIGIECIETKSVQTRECKVEFNEYCYPIGKVLCNKVSNISKKIVEILGINHHARIDFRKTINDEFYVIDVNLLPGLGPIDHFSKCLLLTENISYTDAIKAVINSAAR